MKDIQVLALAPGPSLHKWLKLCRPSVPTIGCSRVPLYYDYLTYYCYGDKLHQKTLPKNPNTIIYARERLMPDSNNLYKLYDRNLPDAGSTGGMAISLGCTMFDSIGLVGYDGGINEFGEILPDWYIKQMKEKVFQYWVSKGKKFYNCMCSESIYDEYLNKVRVA